MATGVVPVTFAYYAHPCHQFVEHMVDRPGRLSLHLEGLDEQFLNGPKSGETLQTAFLTAYNKVLGTCVDHTAPGHNDTNITTPEVVPKDLYARYMTNVTLDSWGFWTAKDGSGADVKYIETEWTAFVGCDDVDQDGDSLGCSPIEPLFYEGDYDERKALAAINHTETKPLSAERRHRQLQQESMTFLQRWLQDSNVAEEGKTNLEVFVAEFTKELQGIMPQTLPAVFYAKSLSMNATGSGTPVEQIGQAYSDGHFVYGSGPGGAIDHPYGLPVCTLPNGNPLPGVELKEGYITVGLQDVDEAFLKDQEMILEQLFRDVYNEVLGACSGDYSRVVQEAKLKKVETKTEQGDSFLSTEWSGVVSCAGCSDHEPLFYTHKSATSSQKNKGGRNLKIEDDSNLAKFANALAEAIRKQYEKVKPGAEVSAFYAAALDASGQVIEGVGSDSPVSTVGNTELLVCATGKAPTETDVFQPGSFELHAKSLVPDMNQTILERAIQNVYNELSGMCTGIYQRVAHEVAITGKQHIVVDDTFSYVDLNVTTNISCTGCEAGDNPMFVDGAAETAARRFLQEITTSGTPLFEQFRSMLTNEVNNIMANYMATTYYEPGAKLFEASDPNAQYPNVEFVWGVTYGRSGNVVQTFGERVAPPAAASNIFKTPQELMAGADGSLVAIPDCKKMLTAADLDRKHGLVDAEYFALVRAMFTSMDPTITWPESMKSYADLPGGVKATFSKFQKGGQINFGDVESVTPLEAEHEKFVEGLCYHTSHSVKDNIQGETAVPTTEAPTTAAVTTEAPTTEAPTTAAVATEAPTTAAVTTEAPTMAPTEAVVEETAAPTAAPTAVETTAAPTAAPIVPLAMTWTIGLMTDLDPDKYRAPTEQELAEFTKQASKWMEDSIKASYDATDEFTFKTISTTLVNSNFANPNITVETMSECIFEGDKPRAEDVALILTPELQTAFANSVFPAPEGFTEETWVFFGLETLKAAFNSA